MSVYVRTNFRLRINNGLNDNFQHNRKLYKN